MLSIKHLSKDQARVTPSSPLDEEDLPHLRRMQSILREISVSKSVTPEHLRELANISDQIAFREKDGECVRNKYGSINRADSCKVREGGIPFMQMAWMRHFALNQIEEMLAEEADGLYKDCLRMQQKVDAVCHQLAASTHVNCDDWPQKIEVTLIASIECQYLQLLVNKLLDILHDEQLSQLHLSVRAHRYYFGTVLISVGELCNEMLFMSCCGGDDDFKFFKTIRNNMMHDYKAMYEATEIMQTNLCALLALLRGGLLQKVSTIESEIIFEGQEPRANRVCGYHASLTKRIKSTNHYLDKWLSSECLSPLSECLASVWQSTGDADLAHVPQSDRCDLTAAMLLTGALCNVLRPSYQGQDNAIFEAVDAVTNDLWQSGISEQTRRNIHILVPYLKEVLQSSLVPRDTNQIYASIRVQYWMIMLLKKNKPDQFKLPDYILKQITNKTFRTRKKSETVDKLKNRVNDQQGKIIGFSKNTVLLPFLLEYEIVKYVDDAQTQTRTNINVMQNDISLYQLSVLCADNYASQYVDKNLKEFLIFIHNLHSQLSYISINPIDALKRKIPDIDVTENEPEVSRLERMLELALEEIRYQHSIIHSESIGNDQKCMMMMFAQSKIGQYFRDIDEIIDNGSAMVNASDKRFINLIETTPLLAEARAKTITSRNKGIAHEILNFNKQSMFNTIVDSLGHMESCLQAILLVARSTRPVLPALDQESMDAFLLDCQNIAEAYIRLGRNRDANNNMQHAMAELDRYAVQEDRLSYEQNQLLKFGRAIIDNELASFMCDEVSSEASRILLKNKLQRLRDDIDNIKARPVTYARLRLNIASLYVFAAEYKIAIEEFKELINITNSLMDNAAHTQVMTNIQQNAFLSVAKVLMQMGEYKRADEALHQVNYHDIDPQSKILQFDYLYAECCVLCHQEEISSLVSKQREAAQLLRQYKGYFKNNYGVQEYLRRKANCTGYAITCFLQPGETPSCTEDVCPGITRERVETMEQLLAQVCWQHDNGNKLDILVDRTKVYDLACQIMRFIEIIIDDRIDNWHSEQFIDIYHTSLLQILEYFEIVIQQYGFVMPLAGIYYCAALCHEKNHEVACEVSLNALEAAVMNAEKGLARIRMHTLLSTGNLAKSDPDSDNQKQRFQEIIIQSIRKIIDLHEAIKGVAASRVMTINDLGQKVLSIRKLGAYDGPCLDFGSGFTMHRLSLVAMKSSQIKLRYYIDDTDDSSVAIIQQAGGCVAREQSQDGHGLVFKMAPQSLTEAICEKLGLIRKGIQTTCYKYIRMLQESLSAVTLEPHCVRDEKLSFVKASYFLTYKKSLHDDVSKALQSFEQPEAGIGLASGQSEPLTDVKNI